MPPELRDSLSRAPVLRTDEGGPAWCSTLAMSAYDVRLNSVLSSMTVLAEESESLEEIARRMRLNDIGSVLVVADDSEEVTGILTERDVVRAIADGVDPATTVVSEYMTPDATTAEPSTRVTDAARTMASLGIRHLPVVTDEQLVGMVSLRDILIELVS
jgi:CBS domain-containing protein